MTVFVILHYNSFEDTVACIDSILNNQFQDKFSIVVVDNNSQNMSGKDLIIRYEKNQEVKIILNESNFGFSKGNNIGCAYAIETFHPDFLCVLNNDTFINDPDFISKIRETYNREKFDALGPKVWNTRRQFNHNPFNVISSLEEVKREIEIAKKGKKLLTSGLPILYHLYLKYFVKRKNYHTV